MRPFFVILLMAILIAPLGLADPTTAPGIPIGCANSTSGVPCKHLPPPGSNVIPNTNVTGRQSYENGTFVGEGTVVVKDGGAASVRNATIDWQATGGGFLVESGGSLVVDASTLMDAGGSDFRIEAQPGSSLTLVGSVVNGGGGIIVRIAQPIISGNTISAIGTTALQLIDVSTTVHGNTFRGNQLAVYQYGGMPTLANNVFEDNYECVHDFQTDPTIIDNVFSHCIIGIWHEQSHSYIARNEMFEDAEPPSVGIAVIDGNSPILEDNTITNFVNGIVLSNARAYIRNNTIYGNVQHGILVDRNSGIMDIQGNVITGNGGDGIRVTNSTNALAIFNNDARSNGGAGIAIIDSIGTTLDGDSATQNAVGIQVIRSQASLRGVNASANIGDGVNVNAASLTVTTSMSCVRAIGNGGAGVVNIRGLRDAQLGWYQSNGGAGVSTGGSLESVVDARNSYWGSSNGPAPTGSGDEISGQVVYVPFLTSPPTAQSCPIG